MLSVSEARCECCQLFVRAPAGNACPRCGYPISPAKEEQFLTASLRDLARVATYSGSQTTIGQLIIHYQRRLCYLVDLKTLSVSDNLPESPAPAQSEVPVHMSAPSLPTGRSASAQQVVCRQLPLFSLKAFFIDQTINILASLGAFLISIGLLSFVTTTDYLSLAFLIALVVHAVFGIIGTVTYRFQQLRIVAVIYTALFALQVPLVGFAAYRLIAGQFIHLTVPTLVAISALYAAIVYAALAVYQQFNLFAYFSVVALAVADLALCMLRPLTYNWWPGMLLLLAFPALLAVVRPASTARLFVDPTAILREAVRSLMFTCVGICGLAILFVPFYWPPHASAQEVRLSLVFMLVLLLCWLCLFAWCTRRPRWLLLSPYLFLACVLATSSAGFFDVARYALSLTIVVLIFFITARSFPRLALLEQHMQAIALLLLFVVPWLLPFFGPVSTLVQWLGGPFPLSVGLAVIALLWYAVAVLTRCKVLLVVMLGFACTALLMPANSLWALALVAFGLMVLASGVSRFAGRDWAVPLYVIALLAALLMGVVGSVYEDLTLTSWLLLLLVLLIYLVGVAERDPEITYVLNGFSVLFAVCSFYYSGFLSDYSRPPAVALVCAAIGISISCVRLLAPLCVQRIHTSYALPFYAMAIVVVLFTGIYGMWLGIAKPFAGAIPDALLIYALLAYGVAFFERRPQVLILVAGFGVWALLLAVQLSVYYIATVGLLACCVALLGGRITRILFARLALPTRSSSVILCVQWSWPWYVIALLAVGLVQLQNDNFIGASGVLPFILYACIALALLVMLVECLPIVILVVAELAGWTISQNYWPFWLLMSFYSLLCVLIFATQFIWRVLPAVASLRSSARLHQMLALGGQMLVVLLLIQYGSLSAKAGALAYVGAGALVVLAGLLCWSGSLRSSSGVLRRCCNYAAGLLSALAGSWLLLAWGQTDLSLLTIIPASYLIVIAPFFARDEGLPAHPRLGRLCAISGASLLLLPTLWSSFSQDALWPTLVLACEALLLFLLGIGLRLRIFVLSGAALVIVSAIHVLSWHPPGIPPFLALTLTGILLLALATTLMLLRSRLTSLWVKLE